MNLPYKLWNIAEGRWWDKEKDDLIMQSPDGTLIQLQWGMKSRHFHRVDVTSEWIKFDCIGLPDKNGELIFEGDICVWRFSTYVAEDEYEIKENIKEIKFDPDFGGYYEIINPYLMNKENEWIFEENEDEYVNDIEIIGHIKTHPELLEKR